jgi:hypothetical protein
VPTATVTRIDEYQRHPSLTSGTSVNHRADQHFSISLKNVAAVQSENAAVLKAVDLYPSLEVQDSEIIQALQLLGSCIEWLQAARQIDSEADFIGFDETMMRARGHLRDLFALRQIGDGFGATINAILWALHNQEVDILTPRQLTFVIEVLGELRRKPLLHFDSAMKLLDQLEDSNLNIEPSRIDFILEFDV